MEDIHFVGLLTILGKRTESLKMRLASNTTLIAALQGVHDKSPVSNWEKELKVVAKHFNLKMPSKD